MSYEIEKELGRGGMGAVYAARDTATGRRVALKVVLGQAAGELRERFIAEARAVAALDHPALVPVHALGVDGDDLFFTMEVVEGRTLAEALDSGELSLSEAVAALAEVARGVDHAHHKGLVHRDLKPGNVMLTPNGGVKILDWGLVGARGGAIGAGVGPVVPGDPRLTRTGAMLGTPAYMAPEQGDGRPEKVGRPADIWAIGAILYHILAGSPPQTGSLIGILRRLAEGTFEPPSARAPDRDVPPALEAVCRKAMAHRPEDRYRSAADLAADLERWSAGGAVSVLPPPWPVRFALWVGRHRLASVAAALALLSTAAIGFAVWRDRRAAAEAVAREEAGRLERGEAARDAARDSLDSALTAVEVAFEAWSQAREKRLRQIEDDEKTLASRPALPPMEPGETLEAFEARTLAGCAAFDWPAFEAAAGRLRGTPETARDLEVARRDLKRRLAAARGALDDLERSAAALGGEGGAAPEVAVRLDTIEMTVALSRYEVEEDLVRRLLASGDLGPEIRQRAEQRIRGTGWIDLGPTPDGCRAILLRATGELLWTGGDPRAGLEPVDPAGADLAAGRRELSAGEYVLLLESGGREVRHAFLVESGESTKVPPVFPERFPPGTVFVPSSDFLAGEGASNTYQALPRHRDAVASGFFIQETEVTIDEWCEFLEDAGVRDEWMPRIRYTDRLAPLLSREGDEWTIGVPWATGDHPVFGVTYLACAAYARWRTERDADWVWRLPTAAEWSLAAGGPAGRVHPWGPSFDPNRLRCRESRGSEYTAPVGRYDSGRSLHGARQMAGNVWEWVATPYSEKWVELYGGSWGSDEAKARVASRDGVLPGYVDALNGFRLVAVPPEAR